MGDEDSTAGLLIVLVDLNFAWWAEQVVSINQTKVNQAKPQGRSQPGNVGFDTALQHFEALSADSPECQGIIVAIWSNICAFLNGYLAAKSSNQVAVIGCYGSHSQFLYCADFEHGAGGVPSTLAGDETKYSRPLVKSEMLGNSSKPETFNYMNVCIRENLKRLSARLTPEEIGSSQQTSLAGALGKALCYSRRVTQQQRLQQQQAAVAGTAVKKTAGGHVLASTAVSASRIKRSTRILAIGCGRETQNQYLHFINAVFTAQKMGVVIDALVLDNENDSLMLQQAADLTSGRYHKISHLRDTLSVLFAAFLIEPSIRDKVYVFRRFMPIDYRAACFCHHKLIDTGFVCSVCLSVFCTFRPICSTCRAHFSLWKNLKTSQMTPTKKLPPSSADEKQHAKSSSAQAVANSDGISNGGMKKVKR